PKIQAKKLRLDNELFESNTPPTAKEKLRAAVPAGTSVILYKNFQEFKPAFEGGKNLEWIRHELQLLPESGASPNTASDQRRH
ncbi:MAG: hypothetical protein WBE52_21825, partial [Terriglobales bacterium]